MVRMFVRHDVKDYATWRAGYDAAGELRGSNGVKGDWVYQSVENGNDVTVVHDFDSVEAAQAFIALPDLKAAMDEIGVVGAPSIWITQGG